MRCIYVPRTTMMSLLLPRHAAVTAVTRSVSAMQTTSSAAASSSWIGNRGVKGSSVVSFVVCSAISLATTTSTTTSSTSPIFPTTTSVASCAGWWKSKATKDAEEAARIAEEEAIRLAEEKAASAAGGISSLLSSVNLPKLPSSIPNINEMNIDDYASVIGSQLSIALSSGIPANLSYGFVAGYASGYALKKIGRVAAIVLGTAFLGMQTLAASGYVTVDHDKIQHRLEDLMDRNKDGKVNASDLKDVVDSAKKVAGFGIIEEGSEVGLGASAAGFGTGFYGGLRSG
jgi:uncharacterized membrane protein (Fun14 family)